MSEISAAIELLRHHIQSDPVLQSRLFEVLDAGEFLALVSQFAATQGLAIEESVLLLAMQQGRRDWIERELP